MRGSHALKKMFKARDFRRIYLARLLAQFADGMFQASLAGSVFFNPQHASTPADLAAGFAILLLPYSLIGPFVGVFLDRLSRRNLMVASNIMRGVLGLCVAATIWFGAQQMSLYVLALLALSLSRFFLSALSACLPYVVERRVLVSANAFTTTSGTVTTIIGGGAAIAVLFFTGKNDHGYALSCVVSTLGSFIAAVVMSRFGKDTLGPSAEDRANRTGFLDVLRGMAQGVTHLRERPACAGAMIAVAMHRFVFGAMTVGILLLFKWHIEASGMLRNGLGGIAQALAAGGLGAGLAALVTPAITRDIGKSAWVALTIGIGGTVSMMLLLPANGWLVLLAAFVMGFAGQGAKVCSDTIIQESVLSSYRGRVFTVYDTLFNAAFVIGIVIAAFTLPHDGRSFGFYTGCAVLYVITGAVYRYVSKRNNHG